MLFFLTLFTFIEPEIYVLNFNYSPYLFFLKLNGTHQLLAYADDVNILGGSIHTVKENAEAAEVATKESGLEVNADKTKYMVMS